MFVQPGVQVNPVIDATPPESDARNTQLIQERHTYPQVLGGLFSGQTAHWWQGQQRRASFMHGLGPYSPLEARR